MDRYNSHNSNAMCELVNFVLKCGGCDAQVDVHDIEDPDNVTSKLSDLQDEYQAQKITDYPLISKTKGNPFTRANMTAFFHALIETAHASGVLYMDLALIDHIEVWITTMSSMAVRPLRHTATVIALSMGSAICNIMKEIVDSMATTMRQKEGEQRRKSINKGRIADFQAKIDENEKRKELAEGWLKDIFDIVFVHRYRDVDPRVRIDCPAALGDWISTCPDVFFEAFYLRYLGWVLSDPSAPTRAEVVKQLLRLYKNKDNVGRLRAFTEKFRDRMVEMATQDSEPAIRASVVELLGLIRDVRLLAPHDIDTIGQLIFDSEPRVRKAVAGFFAQNISDLFESTVEELGGEDGLDEALGEEVEDDYDNPRKVWLKLKCLAEVLQAYDSEDDDEDTQTHDTTSPDMLIAAPLQSRYLVAAQSICEAIPEVKDWEVLAGYLLYDHSSTLQDNNDDPQTAFRVRVQLRDREERLLLEILNAAVKLRLTEAISSETDKKGKRSKARTDESREVQESTALHLAQIIPRLLRKFGASPATASAVLRLEIVLNLDIFQQLRHDSTEYASLLDDINKQFLTHVDHNVLTEASSALLHARGFEDLDEVAEGKMQELWDETTGALRQLANANVPSLTALSSTVQRISSLAGISNCVDMFDAEPGSTSKEKANTTSKVVDILLELIRACGSDEDQDAKPLVLNAMKAMLFYYMWTVSSFRTKVEAGEPIEDIPDYTSFATILSELIEVRPKLDELRLVAIETLLDLYTLFATFKNLKTPPSGRKADNAQSNAIAEVSQEVPANVQESITASFVALEKQFARKSKKTLEPSAEDDPPENLESEPEDSSDEDDEEDQDERVRQARYRKQELLLQENRLCEFTGKVVFAIIGRVLDASGPRKGYLRKRLFRNKSKLGINFKEVLAYLDEPKPKKSHKPRAKMPVKESAKPKAAEKSKELVSAEDDVDEQAEESVGAGEGEDLQRRELTEGGVEESGAAEEVGGEKTGQEGKDDHVMGD